MQKSLPQFPAANSKPVLPQSNSVPAFRMPPSQVAAPPAYRAFEKSAAQPAGPMARTSAPPVYRPGATGVVPLGGPPVYRPAPPQWMQPAPAASAHPVNRVPIPPPSHALTTRCHGKYNCSPCAQNRSHGLNGHARPARPAVLINRGVALPIFGARAGFTIQRATEVLNPSDIPSSKYEERYEKAVTEGNLNLSEACLELMRKMEVDLRPAVSPHTKKGQGTTGTQHDVRNAGVATKFKEDVLAEFNRRHGTNFKECTDALRYLKSQEKGSVSKDEEKEKSQQEAYVEQVKIQQKNQAKSANYGKTSEKKAKKPPTGPACQRWHDANKNKPRKTAGKCPTCGKWADEKPG